MIVALLVILSQWHVLSSWGRQCSVVRKCEGIKAEKELYGWEILCSEPNITNTILYFFLHKWIVSKFTQQVDWWNFSRVWIVSVGLLCKYLFGWNKLNKLLNCISCGIIWCWSWGSKRSKKKSFFCVTEKKRSEEKRQMLFHSNNHRHCDNKSFSVENPPEIPFPWLQNCVQDVTLAERLNKYVDEWDNCSRQAFSQKLFLIEFIWWLMLNREHPSFALFVQLRSKIGARNWKEIPI